MPEMDGFEVIHCILLVIAFSAAVDQQIQKEACSAGCNGFLSKPIHHDELLDCLQTHLHLEWVYTLDTPALQHTEKETATAKLPMPCPELEKLLKIAKQHNILELRKAVADLEHERFAPVVKHLTPLMQSYQFKKIIAFVESLLQANR